MNEWEEEEEARLRYEEEKKRKNIVINHLEGKIEEGRT